MNPSNSFPIAFPPIPYGLKIVAGAERHLTMENLTWAPVSFPRGDSTFIFAPDSTVFSLWQRELTSAGAPFELVTYDRVKMLD